MIESGAFGEQLGALFDKAVQPARAYRVALATSEPGATALVWITEDDGKEVRYDHEPAGFWRRFFSKLVGAFAPDDAL